MITIRVGKCLKDVGDLLIGTLIMYHKTFVFKKILLRISICQ